MSTLTEISQAQQQIHADLELTLAHFNLPSPLKEGVYHAVMLGGKRVRPALCYATSMLNGSITPASRRAAVAVELIHCYSLAHDDLPCMDNDELRRGQPTVHVAFGEATALLAGDILQSMAFEVLGSGLFETQNIPDPLVALKQIQILATASSKMVCGQVLDLQSEGKQVDQATLEKIHLNKTGALIQAAILLGATSAFPTAHQAFAHLRKFGQTLGLAFQVQDDILDITSNTEVLGKTAGKDIQVQKSTYPALLGLEQAHAYAKQLHHEAIDALEQVQGDVSMLHHITEFLLTREN